MRVIVLLSTLNYSYWGLRSSLRSVDQQIWVPTGRYDWRITYCLRYHSNQLYQLCQSNVPHLWFNCRYLIACFFLFEQHIQLIFFEFFFFLAAEFQNKSLNLFHGAGLGYCLTFLPTVTILSQYFTRRRALVTAVASTGESLSMFALAPGECNGLHGGFIRKAM